MFQTTKAVIFEQHERKKRLGTVFQQKESNHPATGSNLDTLSKYQTVQCVRLNFLKACSHSRMYAAPVAKWGDGREQKQSLLLPWQGKN